MAKRSVKKARLREPPPPAAPPEPGGRRPFWLGVAVAALVLIPLAAAGIVIASSSDEDPRAGRDQALERVQSEAARLREQTQVRDKEQVQELTERMRGTVDALAPVLGGMARTFPPGEDEKLGPLAKAPALADWRSAVRKEDRFFAETVSGDTGTNVARGGFAAALDMLGESVETYRLALQQPAARAALLERARQQRNLAVRTWAVAATQLDAINIATGYGHQHVYLGGSEAVGGIGADPAPEGSGAEGGE